MGGAEVLITGLRQECTGLSTRLQHVSTQIPRICAQLPPSQGEIAASFQAPTKFVVPGSPDVGHSSIIEPHQMSALRCAPTADIAPDPLSPQPQSHVQTA